METILEPLLGFLAGILLDPVFVLAALTVTLVVLSGFAARVLELVQDGSIRFGRIAGPDEPRR